MQRLNQLFKLFFALILFCSFSGGIYASSSIDNTAIVILRHSRNSGDNYVFERCYNSVREFYPQTPIVVIDDNSALPIADEIANDTIVVHSEFPGAGELLPYYYFLQYKWADKMIFLHDSMLLKRQFYDSELNFPVKFHWEFAEHHYDANETIDEFLGTLNFGEELIKYNHLKTWNSCFGVTSIIDLSLLEQMEDKYAFTSSLITQVKTRHDRMALERIFGILMFYEGHLNTSNCSNYGCILAFPRYWERVDNNFIEYLKETYFGAILKTWHGR